MSNVNQLLAKALSTDSEEEAISCLRMARKKNGDTSVQTDTQNDDYWKSKAKYYYNLAVDWQKLARRANEATEISQYNYQELVRQKRKIQNERDQLEASLFNYKLLFFGLAAVFIGTVAILL